MPKTPVENDTPEGALIVAKAAMPSLLEPERKKAVSVGLDESGADGAQPEVDEMKVAPEAQLAQEVLP